MNILKITHKKIISVNIDNKFNTNTIYNSIYSNDFIIILNNLIFNDTIKLLMDQYRFNKFFAFVNITKHLTVFDKYKNLKVYSC